MFSITSLKILPFLCIMLLLLSLSACVKTEKDIITPENLILLETHPIAVEDPSGLSRSALEDHFYTVSDKSGNIYLIDTRGIVKKILPVGGDDLEGIEYVEESSTIYVLEERLQWVLSFDTLGTPLDTFQLNIPVQRINDGPEGIAFNPNTQHFYIVNEKNPARLYVYNTRFELLFEYPLVFASDYSSVDYTEEGNHLWILSDESSLLARCNLEGKPDRLFHTGVPKGEGVVVDYQKELIFIVCDETSILYIFSLPQ